LRGAQLDGAQFDDAELDGARWADPPATDACAKVEAALDEGEAVRLDKPRG
jgi:hypothetical protein